MAGAEQYDAIVIGSGQSGGPLSTALVKGGRRTALIEREHIGGTCINEGCTPTKTMVASARVAYLDRRSRMYGVDDGSVSVDMLEVRKRKRMIVDDFRNGSTHMIEEGGVDIIRGEACFTSPTSIDVTSSSGDKWSLAAHEFFIDTGARPADPPIEGLKSVPHLNSTTIMELDDVPECLLVLGGGYIGLEFGQMFRRFGSRVIVVERGPKLLAREDDDIAALVCDIMREDGIEVLLETSAVRVEGGPDGAIHLTVKNAQGERTLTGSHLLVAVGRAPNTESLHLEAAGVEKTDRGFIKVNDRLETTVPNIWAMGDVAGSPAFTHISYDDFRVVRDNLLNGGNRTTNGRLVPYTVFIDPQLGRVGLGEDEAKKAGRNVRVATLPMNHIARAIEVGETRGLMKAVVDADTNQILGCAVLGIEGGEIMAMFEIAMMGKLPYTALRDGIFAHPTLAEAMNNLFSKL